MINHSREEAADWKAGPRRWSSALWQFREVRTLHGKVAEAKWQEHRAYLAAADASFVAGKIRLAHQYYAQALITSEGHATQASRKMIADRISVLFWSDPTVTAERGEHWTEQRNPKAGPAATNSSASQ